MLKFLQFCWLGSLLLDPNTSLTKFLPSYVYGEIQLLFIPKKICWQPCSIIIVNSSIFVVCAIEIANFIGIALARTLDWTCYLF